MESLSSASEEDIDVAEGKIRFLVSMFGKMAHDQFNEYTQEQAMTLTIIALTELVTRWILVDGDGKITTAKLNRFSKGVRACARAYQDNPEM